MRLLLTLITCCALLAPLGHASAAIAGCGFSDSTGNIFDFSPLANETLVGSNDKGDSYTYLFKMCGVVDAPQGDDPTGECRQTRSSICQLSVATGQYISSLAAWGTSTPTWSTTSTGVVATFTNGSPCGSKPKTTRVIFICDESILVPATFAVAEDGASCTFNTTIRTVLACTAQPPPPVLGCSFTAPSGHVFDFSGLTAYTLTGKSASGDFYLFLLKMCGVVDAPQGEDPTGQCRANQASLCQLGPDGTFISTVAAWTSPPTWGLYSDASGSGVTTGNSCGPTPRTAHIFLRCDPSHVVPDTFAVAEDQSCTYNTTITTALACSSQAPHLLSEL